MVKVAPRVQVKPSPQLKNLFVLSKDGVKTPLTIGADGKLTAGLNQRFIMINKVWVGIELSFLHCLILICLSAGRRLHSYARAALARIETTTVHCSWTKDAKNPNSSRN